jgi:transposase InsO family protein
VLVELGLVEQRYKAVCEVLDGATVVDVARRNGVTRQTVHDWLRAYATQGLAGLADRSSKPATCPHQMAATTEARIVELRRAHPAWGPRRLLHQLGLEGIDPLPGRSSVYRALIRHGLLDPKKRKRRKEDYKRWERSRSMELWQMDVVGRIHLADGTELSAVTGLDDHSRFCVCARLVARAQAKPVCDALTWALRTLGIPDQILTDNGKVFTARFGKGPGPVLFDRICTDNGIRHLLTAPYSPTTTGKSSASTRPCGRSG